MWAAENDYVLIMSFEMPEIFISSLTRKKAKGNGCKRSLSEGKTRCHFRVVLKHSSISSLLLCKNLLCHTWSMWKRIKGATYVGDECCFLEYICCQWKPQLLTLWLKKWDSATNISWRGVWSALVMSKIGQERYAKIWFQLETLTKRDWREWLKN